MHVLLQFDADGIDWKSGECEQMRVRYVDFTGSLRTTTPDFVLDNKRVIECKPKHLQNTISVQAKANALREHCERLGMTYEFIDPVVITWNTLSELEVSGDVVLTEHTREKLYGKKSES